MLDHYQNQSTDAKSAEKAVSTRSLVGLNAVNFFLAEVVGVIMPFLATYLKQKEWSYSQIGLASAAAGLGTLLFQTPAGVICDRFKDRKTLLAVTSIILGICYAVLPFFSKSVWWADTLLFCSGVAGAFFVPLLATLALSLVGDKKFDSTMGVNQSWNHAGNITAALSALLIVRFLGIEAIFFIMGSVSFLAVGALALIKTKELDPNMGCEATVPKGSNVWRQFKEFLSDPQTRTLLICVALFHLANAPVMPLVGLYIKHLGGADTQVAWVVLVAQVVMVPTALLAGKYGASLGRKPVLAFAFCILPVRILTYAFTKNETALIGLQALDGIGAGIYGVVIALICSDLTRGKGGFNLLMGMAATALAFGGFTGPLVQGFVTDKLGFPATFISLALIAAVGAVLFVFKMPETKSAGFGRRSTPMPTTAEA